MEGILWDTGLGTSPVQSHEILCCKGQKRNADQQIPQLQRAGVTCQLCLGLTKESLLIPAAATFHLTVGTA